MSSLPAEFNFNRYMRFVRQNKGAQAADSLLQHSASDTAPEVHSRLAVAYEIFVLRETLEKLVAVYTR
jgi:hypothetical protein